MDILTEFHACRIISFMRIPMPDKNTLQELYFAKRLPARAIAQRFGVGNTTVFRWFERYGIKLRPKGLPNDLRPTSEELRRLYIEEKLASGDLARRFNCTQTTICKWLSQDGIEKRSPSEAKKLDMARWSYEDRIRITKNSRNTTAFKTVTHERRCKMAIAKQKKPRLSIYESSLFTALLEMGIRTIPQYAIDKYNIDLAIPEIKLAIEVDGGNWHSTATRKQAQDASKKEYLDSIGWDLLRIKTRRPNWVDLATVAISLCSK